MPTTVKRPTINDDVVIKAAVEKLLPKVLEWLQQNGDTTDYAQEDEEKDNVISQLVGAVKGSFDNDGYHLAKELDGDGWDPDASLVDILDSTSQYLRSACRDFSTVWFKEQGIVPYAKGTKVKSSQRGDTNGRVGTIYDATEDGRYTVNIPELGHCEPNSGKPGCYGIILDHENLQVL